MRSTEASGTSDASPSEGPSQDGTAPTPGIDEDEVDLRITSLDLGDEAVFITNPDGTILDVNEAFVRVTGYSRDEAIGSTPRLLASGLQDESFYRDLWETISSGRVWQGQMVDRRRDGALRTFHSTISPIIDGRGTIRCFVALERDITGELAISQGRPTSGLLHTDLQGRGTYADGLAAAMLERRPSELLGNGLLHALAEEDADAFCELIAQAVDTGHEHHTEVRTAAGKWLRVSIAPMTVASGDVLGATCLVQDVDEQIGAQRTIERQRALIDSVLNAIPEPVAVAGPDGRVVAKNRAWGAEDDGMPEPIRSATVDSDLMELARTAADRATPDDRMAIRLARDLQRAFAGVMAPPRRDHGYVVTPLAWDDGGAVVRWLGAD